MKKRTKILPESPKIINFLLLLICSFVIVILLGISVTVRNRTKISRGFGIANNFYTVNPRNQKNLVFYTATSNGACPSQKLSVETTTSSLSSYNSAIGTSYFKINIPPLSISNTLDVVVNETQFFTDRNVVNPMLTMDMVKTDDFLCYWIANRETYGISFNPDTYVLNSLITGYDIIPNTFSNGIPPAIELMYFDGVSSGVCVRNLWHGYVIDIDYGAKFDGVSSYDITVQGTCIVPSFFYKSYLFSHDEPTNNDPHVHVAPRLNNSKTQKLNPVGTENLDYWNIKISRGIVAPESSACKTYWPPSYPKCSAISSFESAAGNCPGVVIDPDCIATPQISPTGFQPPESTAKLTADETWQWISTGVMQGITGPACLQENN